jgi:hypothetical protein
MHDFINNFVLIFQRDRSDLVNLIIVKYRELHAMQIINGNIHVLFIFLFVIL